MYAMRIADAVLTVAKGKLMADKLLASGGMTKDKSVRDVIIIIPYNTMQYNTMQ